jgi:hypothetical protein
MGRFVILFTLAASTVTVPTMAQARGGTFHLFSAQAAERADAAAAAARASAPVSIRTVEHVPNWRRARALAHSHDVRTVGSI